MRFRILFTLLGLLQLAGCGAVDDVGRGIVQNSDEIGRIASAILANVDETARASSLLGDDASRLSTQLFNTYGSKAGQVVAEAASLYGDDFASQGRYIDDLVLPILDDTDEYARLVSQQDEELSGLSRILDDYQMENLAPDLLCLNLEKLIAEGVPASSDDYQEFFQEKIGNSLLGPLDITWIYSLSEDLREFVEAVEAGDSSTTIYYRLRLKTMCASLK